VEIKCPKCRTPIEVRVYTVKTGANLPKHTPINRVKSLIPDGFLEMLEFSEAEGRVHIKPKEWLDKENFRTIAAIVRDAGGEYVSQRKDSYFRI
jgi:hypothetical protein